MTEDEALEEEEQDGGQEEDAGDEDDEEEENVVGHIELDEHWNEGKIKVNINRCHDCAAHY